MPEPAPAGEPAAPADPYADWTDEEKAEWQAGEKFRARHADELVDRILDAVFAEPEGGGTVGPDGKAAEPAPGAPAGAPPAAKAGVPWWDRRVFGLKRKPPATPAAPATPAPAAKP
jgi:hypothetical protein